MNLQDLLISEVSSLIESWLRFHPQRIVASEVASELKKLHPEDWSFIPVEGGNLVKVCYVSTAERWEKAYQREQAAIKAANEQRSKALAEEEEILSKIGGKLDKNQVEKFMRLKRMIDNL